MGKHTAARAPWHTKVTPLFMAFRTTFNDCAAGQITAERRTYN